MASFPNNQGDGAGAIPVYLAVNGGGSTPNGYQQVTDLTAATSPTVPAGTTSATFTPETEAVRYRMDGVAPTATVGQFLAVGTPLILGGANLAAVEFIAVAAGAILNVTYSK